MSGLCLIFHIIIFELVNNELSAGKLTKRSSVCHLQILAYLNPIHYCNIIFKQLLEQISTFFSRHAKQFHDLWKLIRSRVSRANSNELEMSFRK